MRANQNKSIKKPTRKVLLAGVLSFGAISAFAKVPTPQPQAPPPPDDTTPQVGGK